MSGGGRGRERERGRGGRERERERKRGVGEGKKKGKESNKEYTHCNQCLYLATGGPPSACPFSVITLSDNSPLEFLTCNTLEGALVNELFDELDAVLGLGIGEVE